MAQIFDVLGKLKTLFFETTWAIFFVVTNKQAYDYYLTNKHQEDDIISNIFNKIIYIPWNSMDNFNLNMQIDVTSDSLKNLWTKEKEKSDDQIDTEGSIKNNEKIDILKEKRLLRNKVQKYIYFKSHGNWRKSKFELSNMIKNNEISLEEDKFKFDYKFYEFFDKLYRTFDKNSLVVWMIIEKFLKTSYFLWRKKMKEMIDM